ncbi:hypothetical protein GL218_06128 [Daldinia childiae]|uniref:uncharacterized protein n=1 Tax=Daldinia childiae TaxID=326645 RepID=UPI00144888D4|nr:uncharacterized protein GL218_06128 [Daldinia childiae]KAF3057241.1 hypothetical protein GL218_06128 [Daldinia childiae]
MHETDVKSGTRISHLSPQLAAATPGSLPLTPPSSPGPYRESKSSPDTTSHQSHQSHQSRQEYLDSLQPPSKEEFQRLTLLQEQREKEHKRRDQELRRQSIVIAHTSMQARRDFMQSKVAEEEERLGHHHSIFGHRHSNSKSRSRPSSKNAMSDEKGEAADGCIRSKAATVIQRTYRGYRVRREMQGLGLDAGTRWTHAIRDAQWKDLNTPRARQNSSQSIGNGDTGDQRRPSSSRSTARKNWMKVAKIARRAGADEDSDHAEDSSSSSLNEEDFQGMSAEKKAEVRKKQMKARAKRRERARMMGLQYFLEMVDLKHRYGSNLRAYHEEWKKSDTNENFFYWLDYGEGRKIALAACPRERLDREQVRYLSREERQYYLVKVDVEGRLVWAKNGMRVDTTERWKDSIHGIVPIDDPTPSFTANGESHVQAKSNVESPTQQHIHSGSSSPRFSRDSELEAAMAAKYADPDFDDRKGVRKIRHVSAATIFNKLLRKTVRKNTWIFVADTSFRLYVGVKNSGAFQHSSFLQGSRISAAGLIKIKNGRLSSLSPLSGHYRPPASNFRAFVHSLEEEGVDMSHVSISKSYAVLVGLEAYIKTKKKGKEAMQTLTHQKQKLLDPEEARKKEEAELDTSQSAAKERKFLEKEREKEEVHRVENKATFKFMQKLQRFGFQPRTPSGQKNSDAIHDSKKH